MCRVPVYARRRLLAYRPKVLSAPADRSLARVCIRRDSQPDMSTRVPWQRITGLALVVGMLAAASPALAASCRGASHEASLTNGSVSPDSGTAGSSFRFKVTYSDNASCVPARVSVRVNGVGSYDMAAHGSSAVSYQRDVVLPAGSFRYWFEAESGSGPGYQLVTLSDVSPSRLTVSNPAPKPTPKATPPPTPKPTPPPTPRPAVATPKPAPATPQPLPATPAPVAVASLEPSPSATTSAEASPESTSSADSTRSPGAAGPGGAAGGGRTSGLGVITPLAEPTSALPWLVAWAVATGGGLAAFVFLVRRGSAVESSVALATGGGVGSGPSAPESGPPPRRRKQTGDETQLPRWLRPSVQAARYARPGQGDNFRDD